MEWQTGQAMVYRDKHVYPDKAGEVRMSRAARRDCEWLGIRARKLKELLMNGCDSMHGQATIHRELEGIRLVIGTDTDGTRIVRRVVKLSQLPTPVTGEAS
jgi:hypothetical protein